MPVLPKNANETRLQISERAASALLKELDVKSSFFISYHCASAPRTWLEHGWYCRTMGEENTSIYKSKNVLGLQWRHRCVKYCTLAGFYNPVGVTLSGILQKHI